ncbi:glycine cleavage system protein R [Nitrogeniibacter mangrovi]|uniref:Glycine cleavage system protein R n=1 Tax=Nitrogeniibacter mangrovi TaxID=2016596 RepID=A0A6C1B4F8_9RHOO|nr:ACT domain-containing protein [Nitrogeniibacter mangrovi]QID17889.1 glycine cleavage system protein R [Nitrogeniibacter mangrovi]
MKSLVLTVIGDDRPGLVGELSRLISDQGGNWLESSMAQLAGKFAGILRVDVADAEAAALIEALEGLEALKVHVTQAGAPPASGAAPRRLHLTLVGQDRVGIVREVSQVLARHRVNVEELNTLTSSAPMSGETLFHARASLQADRDLDAGALKTDLEALSNDLIVDISLDEVVSI